MFHGSCIYFCNFYGIEVQNIKGKMKVIINKYTHPVGEFEVFVNEAK